ncbi:IS5 family transposase [Xanthomonas axonopodis pv. vasculorum]|uniref:IS5 family transposase n=1 Tax=Xanthomonas axonopodis TaxID=53413 RepID=UPI0014957B6B|nr:IS5 family transposase [Xanthomonas axonopodis]QKD86345.1 IS5 family transposase [Xanthomonas axonopodis pv. vasculorum]
MEITPAQCFLIEHCLPAQRGNVSMTNLQVVNAILYVAEHGCKWRGLPKHFGNWHTVYTRMNRWAKAGVLDRMFAQLQKSQIVRIKIEAVSLDSTSVKVHPDGAGALKKNRLQAIGKSRGGWNTKIHLIAADARTAILFGLTPGNAHDAPAGRTLLEHLGAVERPIHLLMDRAYEGNQTRQLARDLGFVPVVPPKSNRVEPWDYNREMYNRRNEVERLFRRLKGDRRIFTRFEKLDVMFLGFLSFALVVEGLRMC